MTLYGEVVFCGYGEPTCALDVLLPLARDIKAQAIEQGNPGVKVRLDTNGQGSLIAGRDICPELAGVIDAVSVSLNTPNPIDYLRLNRSKFGEAAYDGMLRFVKDVRTYVPDVTLTTVQTTLTDEQEHLCQEICDELGVAYRIRPWQD